MHQWLLTTQSKVRVIIRVITLGQSEFILYLISLSIIWKNFNSRRSCSAWREFLEEPEESWTNDWKYCMLTVNCSSNKYILHIYTRKSVRQFNSFFSKQNRNAPYSLIFSEMKLEMVRSILSSTIFSQGHPFLLCRVRKFCHWIITLKHFDNFILGCILISSALLAIEDPINDENNTVRISYLNV